MKRLMISTILAVCSIMAYAQSDSLSLGYGVTVSKLSSSMSADAASQEQLLLTDSPNVLNSLYSILPGLRVSQGASQPWGDSPSLTIRGTGSINGGGVLVVVDGIERDAALVNPNEVERVTVLRDAAATAIYGNRGADGVVVITTKRGTAKETKIKFGYTYGLETPFRIPQMANSLEYANALNEACLNDLIKPTYTEKDLAAISEGQTSYLPNNNWQDMILRQMGHRHNFNISFDGAKEKVKYFVYSEFNGYNGLFKNTKLNDGYSTQNESVSLKVRGNIDAQITRTTVAKFDFMGYLNQYQTPAAGDGLSSMHNVPALAFPIKEGGKFVRSTLFSNPFEDKVGLGYTTYLNRTLYANLLIDQDFVFVTPGLRGALMFGYDNSALIHDSRPYTDSYKRMEYTRDIAGDINGVKFTDYGDQTGNGFGTGLNSQYMTFSTFAKLSYDRNFGKHHVDAMGMFFLMSRKLLGANNKRLYQDNIFNAGYNYDNKYFVNATVNVSGSAKLAYTSKYRVLPSVSAAWLISNEDFLKNSKITHLKLRASYGVVASDAHMYYDMDQQQNGGGKGYTFRISPTGSAEGGYTEGPLPTPDLQPEKDHKSNLAVEFEWDRRFSAQLEGFFNNRTCLQVPSAGEYSSVLGVSVTDITSGRAINYGAELSLGWQDKVGDFTYHVNANVAWTRSKIIDMAEAYHPFQYMYLTGQPIGSFYGLTYDGLYQESDFDSSGKLNSGVVRSSYVDVQPGDVKYKDMNNDGVIDDYDFSYHHSSTPDILLGIQLGLQYKNFGFEADFGGEFGSMVGMTLSSIYQPLYNNDKNISKWALENHWSKDNTSSRYPRLTTLSNANNYISSDLWRQAGSFFKLRNLYVWYDIKCPAFSKIGLNYIKVFLRGNNLFSVDSVKLFDPEAINMNYPSVRIFQAGVKFDF